MEELLFFVVAVGLSVDEFASELTDCLSVESTKYHILRELMMPPAAAALARPPADRRSSQDQDLPRCIALASIET